MKANIEIPPTEFQQHLKTLGGFFLSLSDSTTTVGHTVMTAEKLAGIIDPELVPALMIAQIALPLVGEALEILAVGKAVPGNYWLGAPRAI